MLKLLSALCLVFLIALAAVFIPIAFPVMGVLLLVAVVLPFSRRWAKTKAYHLWIAFDKFANAMRFHDHRETISSCLGKAIYHGHPPVFNWLCIDIAIGWLLDRVDENHCEKSIDWSVGRGLNWHLKPYNFL